MRRPTKRGIKIRVGIRKSQIKKKIATLNIGANDAENLFNTLTKDIQTKRGFLRSQKMEDYIFSNDPKKLKKLLRFKEFNLSEGSYKPNKIKLSDIFFRMFHGYWGDSESAFMKKNRGLVNEYNDLTNEQKQDKDNAIVSEMKDKYAVHVTKTGSKIVTRIEKAAEVI